MTNIESVERQYKELQQELQLVMKIVGGYDGLNKKGSELVDIQLNKVIEIGTKLKELKNEKLR